MYASTLPIYGAIAPLVVSAAIAGACMAAGKPETMIAVAAVLGGALGCLGAGGFFSAAMLCIAAVCAYIWSPIDTSYFMRPSWPLAYAVCALAAGFAAGAVGAFADAVAATIQDGAVAGGTGFAAPAPCEKAANLRSPAAAVRKEAVSTIPEQTQVPPTSFADVVIVGAGTAGASLAARLARDGRKVAVVESHMQLEARIVGELMQPGGVRSLERMGLADACKDGRARSVRVDGYVVVPKATDAGIRDESMAKQIAEKEQPEGDGFARRDARIEGAVLLKYPSTDPEGGARHFGFGAQAADEAGAVEAQFGEETRRVNAALDLARAAGVGAYSEEKELDVGDGLTDAQSGALAGLGGAGGNGTGTLVRTSASVPQGTSQWGVDPMPRGRSFHNHRFVAGLRRLAFREQNVRLCVGRARDVLRCGGEGDEVAKAAAAGDARRVSDLLVEAEEEALGRALGEEEKQVAERVARQMTSAASKAYGTSGRGGQTGEGRAVGIRWVPHGESKPRTVHAPLVVIADGMFSGLRRNVTSAKPRLVSHFVGLVMHHPPMESPLPYRHRGHVCLTEPTPTLAYQISPCATRLLVDCPTLLPSDDGLYLPLDGEGEAEGERKEDGEGEEEKKDEDEEEEQEQEAQGTTDGVPPGAVKDLKPGTRVKKVVKDSTLAAYIRYHTLPQLPAGSLREAARRALDTQVPQPCGNRYLPVAPEAEEDGRGNGSTGVVLLGDAWNMRHPLTGGGMTVALKDTEALADALRGATLEELRNQGVEDLGEEQARKVSVDLGSPAALDAALDGWKARRTTHASTVNVLANALYDVFSVPEEKETKSGGSGNKGSGNKLDVALQDPATRKGLRDACLNYLGMGGACSAGPVHLLAALTPSPGVLTAHFFSVAFKAVGDSVLPVPTPSSVRQAYMTVWAACRIVMPLLADERATPLAWPAVQTAVNLLFPWRDAHVSAVPKRSRRGRVGVGVGKKKAVA